MGRRREHQPVESCWGLDVLALAREGFCAPSQRRASLWIWRNALGQKTSSVMLIAEAASDTPPAVRVRYTLTLANGQALAVDEVLPLDTMSPSWGNGCRWWWRCLGCGERRQWLYLPCRGGGGGHYRCRTCYGLTYASSQASDRRVAELARAYGEWRRPSIAGIYGAAALGLHLTAMRLAQRRMLRKLSPGRRERFRRLARWD